MNSKVVLPLKRAPIGFADVTAGARQSGLDLAVQGGGHQGFPAVLTGGVNDQAAVGGETGPLVRAGVRERVDRISAQLHDLQFEGAVDAGNVRKQAAVGADRWRYVVTPRKRHPFGVTSRRTHAVYLRRTATITHKIDGFSISRIGRFGVDAGGLRQPLGVATIEANGINLRPTVPGQCGDQLFTVGRPSRRTVGAPKIGKQPPLARSHIVRIDDRLAGFERHIGQLGTIGRP